MTNNKKWNSKGAELIDRFFGDYVQEVVCEERELTKEVSPEFIRQTIEEVLHDYENSYKSDVFNKDFLEQLILNLEVDYDELIEYYLKNK